MAALFSPSTIFSVKLHSRARASYRDYGAADLCYIVLGEDSPAYTSHKTEVDVEIGQNAMPCHQGFTAESKFWERR